MMSSSSQLEQAAERMRQLAASQLANKLASANEAETRLLIIDTVLSILGWNKDEYKPEQPTTAGGFTDYRLTIDGHERLIVEAKKIGIIGPLPKSIQRQMYQNSFLINNCGEEMNCLLTQCQKYCADCGIPYALATTGSIWIVLIGFRTGVGWGRLRSFVFHSIEDLSRRFSQFYGLVSKEAIKNNSLEEKFGSEILRKADISIRPREQVDTRTLPSLVSNRGLIELFFESFLGDITRPERSGMLEHCYVDDHRLNEFSRDLQQLLDAETALDEQGAIDRATAEELESAIDLQHSSSNPKTILLVGNVGAGKSTFIHRFVKMQARPNRNVCVVVDLINRSTIKVNQDREEENELSREILETLAKDFKQEKMDPYDPAVVRGCFEMDLGRFGQLKRTLYELNQSQYRIDEEEYLFSLCKNSYRHLIGYLKYLRKKRRLAWLAFDNVDRGSESYQKFVYAYAHKLAAEANCVTLITLREDTYLEARESGFLDVRTSDIIFRVTPPEFRQVVSKRRKYVDYLLKYNKLPQKLGEHSALVVSLISHINKLVLGDDESIRILITTFSLNNMRYSLRMLRNYYSSYHSTFHDFLEISTTETHIPQMDYAKEYERFLRVLILGSGWVYKEDVSEILNVFSADPIEQTSHFLILRTLAYLHINRNLPKGAVKYEKLSADLVFLGHPRYHIDKALRKLLYAGLIISPHLPASPAKEERVDLPEEFQDPMKLSLSAKGYFYLLRLAGDRYYQTRVGEDTVWYNEELARHYIKCLTESVDAQPAYGSDDALMVTDAREIFLSYLRKAWLEEIRGGIIRDSPLTWARIIKETVEKVVFGSPSMTAAPPAEQERPESDRLDSAPDNVDNSLTIVSPRIIPASIAAAERQRQMPLFAAELPVSAPDYKRALQDALKSLGPLREEIRHRKNVYIVRVLWALELCLRAGLGAQRASDIATIMNQYGGCHAAPTNVARFIRDQKRDGEYSYCWRESFPGAYVISASGRELLATLLKS